MINFCHDSIHTLKVHKSTQQILNKNNEDCESTFTPSTKVRITNYEMHIIKNEKNSPGKQRLGSPERIIINHINIPKE